MPTNAKLEYFVFDANQMIIAIHRGLIPPNLHFNEPNEYIEGLKDGSLKVVTEPTPFPAAAFVGVNSFGFGGSNTHVVLKAPVPTKMEDAHVPKPSFPRLVLYSGRTKEALENVFQKVREEAADNQFVHQLLSGQVRTAPTSSWHF
jgi:fatty acid synthase, animal type